MHTVDTNLQKKKEDLAEIQHLLLILQLQKQHVTNKIKNSMKTVETIKACNVRKQESTMYANKTDSNSKMINNDKKKPMRNTYYLSMKPVSIQSLRKTRTGFSSSSNNNYNVGSSLVENDFIDLSIQIQKKAELKNCKILLPIDVVCSKNLEDRKHGVLSS